MGCLIGDLFGIEKRRDAFPLESNQYVILNKGESLHAFRGKGLLVLLAKMS